MRQIVLLTDFGLQDHYVGVMKGVITGITESHNIIDLTHNIQPQNILQAAFILSHSAAYFSEDTVFCCVVDPGVGSKRNIIIVRNGKQVFVAPDNGLLSGVIATSSEIYYVNNSFVLDLSISSTFHGRDVFAPIAAELSIGNESKVIGDETTSNNIQILDLKEIDNGDKVLGTILNIDIYGNIISNISKKHFISISSILSNSITIANKSNNYIDADDGLFYYVGSCDTIEIAIKNKSANEILNVKIGDSVIAKKRAAKKIATLNI